MIMCMHCQISFFMIICNGLFCEAYKNRGNSYDIMKICKI